MLLVGQQEEHPARKKTWAMRCWHGVVVCCLKQGANDLHMVQLMPRPPCRLCFRKIQNGLSFWLWPTREKVVKGMLLLLIWHWVSSHDFVHCVPMPVFQLDGRNVSGFNCVFLCTDSLHTEVFFSKIFCATFCSKRMPQIFGSDWKGSSVDMPFAV